MPIKPETQITREIMSFVSACGGDSWKVNGSSMQRVGEPDLDGAIPVMFIKQTDWRKYRREKYTDIITKRIVETLEPEPNGLYVHFKVEVKDTGNYISEIQRHRLQVWDNLGYCTGVVYSLEEFKTLIEQYARKHRMTDKLTNGYALSWW